MRVLTLAGLALAVATAAAIRLAQPTASTPAASTQTTAAQPSQSSQTPQPSQTPQRFGYTIVKTYPHDREAFTQGLEYMDGVLYEGTGLTGRSSIRKVHLETGKVLQQRNIPAQYFGEGITIWKGDLFQLTWRSGVAFVYDRESFAEKRSFRYTGEGWGLTHDETALIMSDGTDAIRFLDPVTFVERRRIRVMSGGLPVDNLNELEFVKGEIFANVWYTEEIVRIDPGTGRVTGRVDLSGLLTPADQVTSDAVLNGIAYDAAGDRLFVTGKLWPKLFEIKVVAQ